MVDKNIPSPDYQRNRRFRSPFSSWARTIPVAVQAISAVVIAVLTYFIYQVNDKQREISVTANKILTGQKTIMRRQSDIMDAANQTQRATNRAFVYFDKIRLRPYPAKNPNIYGIEFTLINSGDTPARKLIVRSECSHPPAGEEPYSAVNWASLKSEPLTFLGPKQTIDLQGCNIAPAKIAGTKDRSVRTFIVIDAQYVDSFVPDKERVTQLVMRLQYDKDGGHSFEFVGPHNCTDEDCP